MKPDNTLTITSLLALVLMTFHLKPTTSSAGPDPVDSRT
jgi:hypothetical protein